MKYRLITFLFAFAISCFSQTGSVLWKITGKGLSRPSYIYGTVHITDKRVFYANDSLMQYISLCDYFASELHPDSLNAMMFGMMTREDTTDTYRRTFDSEDYEEVNKKLEKELGINLKQLRRKNLRGLKMLLNPYQKKKDDYPTFLDGYLIGIAKRSGKKIIGLEGIRSHELALPAVSEELYKKDIVEISKGKKGESSLELLIKTYLAADLATIESNYADFSYEVQYNLLDRRNVIMTQTIDSIIKEGSTIFAAFGAAHLPGKTGIIRLLAEKGYTLSPVISKNKAYLSTESLPVSYNNWHVENSAKHGISYSLPGPPGNTMKNVFYSDYRTYPDITTGFSYSVFPLTVALGSRTREEVFDKYAEIYSERSFGSTIKKNVPIKYKNLEGRQIEIDMGSSMHYVRLFSENNVFYMVSVAVPHSQKDLRDMNYFFDNISIYKPVETAAEHYENKKWGIEMDFPSTPAEKTKINKYVGARSESLSLMATDNVNGVYYILEAVEAGPGRYYENDSSILFATKNFVKSSDKGIVTKDTFYLYQNNRCVEVSAVANDSSYILNRVVMRGYKVFSMSCIMSASTVRNHTHEAFFNSFSFLPLETNTFKEYKFAEDSALTVRLPQKPYKEKRDTNSKFSYLNYDADTSRYLSYDPQTCITYYLKQVPLERYYYDVTDSAYWKETEDRLIGYNDTLYSVVPVNAGSYEGRLFTYGSKAETSIAKFLQIKAGDYEYHLYTFMPKEIIYEQELTPFTGFNYAKRHADVKHSDTAAFRLLLKDLESADSAAVQEARSAMYSFALTDNMLPMVKQILEDDAYKPDTVMYFDLKYRLINKLHTLKNKEEVWQYARLKINSDKDSAYWSNYLDILANDKRAETYSEIRSFLMKNIRQLPAYNSVLYNLRDSIELARPFFPDILKAFTYEVSQNYALLHITRQFLDTAVISYNDFQPYERYLFDASSVYAGQKYDKKDIYSVYYDETLLDILNHSGDKTRINEHSRMLSKSENPWASLYGNIYLLKNKQDVSASSLKKIASVPYFRNYLYTELNKIDKSVLFPSKYNNQKALAEADVHKVLIDYDEVFPEKVVYLKEYKTTYNEKKCTFYLYKVSYDEESEASLYAAGPYYEGEMPKNEGELTGYVNSYMKGAEDVFMLTWLAERKN